MNIKLEQDLKKSLTMIDNKWSKQTNNNDKETNFIYKVNNLDDCLNEIRRTGVDQNYALHRWFNFHTSIYCESIFCDFGAVADSDKYNHDVDVHIKSVPFDVKLTVYPAKLNHRPYNLKTRAGRDDMIKWLYANQSQGARKQLLNRLYVLCDAGSVEGNMALKCDFDLMRTKIGAFMEIMQQKDFNELTITDENKQYQLKTDLIYLKK